MISTKFRAPNCYDQDAYTKLSKQYTRCMDAVTKKYQPKYRKWNERKEYAKTVGAYQKARKMLAKLERQEAKEREKKCYPIEGKLHKKLEKLYEDLCNFVVDNPPTTGVDTPAVWMAESFRL